jgi:nucleoid-associated protein YgaU
MTQTTRNRGLIRMALMGTAFVGLTVVLVVFQPGSPRHAANKFDQEPSVTRVATSALNDVVSASGAENRAVTPDAVIPAASTASDAVEAEQPNSMRDLTFGAISNLKSATTGTTPPPGQPGSLLHSVVQRSIGTTPTAPPQTRPAEPVVATAPVQAVPQPVPATVSYIVKPGDTLVGIARALYGDVNMASTIFLRNTDVMSRPDSLQAGMVLALPAN